MKRMMFSISGLVTFSIVSILVSIAWAQESKDNEVTLESILAAAVSAPRVVVIEYKAECFQRVGKLKIIYDRTQGRYVGWSHEDHEKTKEIVHERNSQ